MKISVLDVSRRFGDFATLDRVDLEVRSGELLALLGPVVAELTVMPPTMPEPVFVLAWGMKFTVTPAMVPEGPTGVLWPVPPPSSIFELLKEKLLLPAKAPLLLSCPCVLEPAGVPPDPPMTRQE